MSSPSEPRSRFYHLLLLDASGSMGIIRQATIDSFNAVTASIRELAQSFPAQEHRCSLLTFNSKQRAFVFFDASPEQLPRLTPGTYQPNSSTPLHDALGEAIERQQAEVARHPGSHVLVTILTDGLDNASFHHTAASIRLLVQTLSDQGWTFTYLGANHDAAAVADDLAIPNALHFEAAPEQMPRLVALDKAARLAHVLRVTGGEDARRGYFPEQPAGEQPALPPTGDND
jgi:Mg-chelatase subunit ChlD